MNKMKLLTTMTGLWIALLALHALGAIAVQVGGQTRQSYGLHRSYSDPNFRLNSTRNHHHHHSHRGGHSCKTNYKFDYVQLTLMWPPGSCSTSPQECTREQNKHFTVHGMWPTLMGTEEPSNCCFDNTFDYKSLEPLMPSLNEYWYSYYESHGSRSFWSHEWLKHGTCARDIPALRGEVQYFGNTVDLAKRLPILETLKKANIIPDNGKVYSSQDISQALVNITQGKSIQIDCDYEHQQPTPLLKGLNFCFDSNLKSVDCPEMKRRCQRKLIFPNSSTRFARKFV